MRTIPEDLVDFLEGGGNVLIDADKKPILSANLTPDDETGIGRWSEADFIRAVKQGMRPDGRALHAPMLPRPTLEDDEVGAIYTYLPTVPMIRDAVRGPAVENTAASAAKHPGKALYTQYGCGGCHGESGASAIADLRGANERHPSDESLRAWIEDAPRLKPGTRMPAWKGIIRDEDYAPLMGYVRLLTRQSKSALR